MVRDQKPRRYRPSPLKCPSMYREAAAALGPWNPSITTNCISSDGFQCRFLWLMNQLSICFISSPVDSANSGVHICKHITITSWRRKQQKSTYRGIRPFVMQLPPVLLLLLRELLQEAAQASTHFVRRLCFSSWSSVHGPSSGMSISSSLPSWSSSTG